LIDDSLARAPNPNCWEALFLWNGQPMSQKRDTLVHVFTQPIIASSLLPLHGWDWCFSAKCEEAFGRKQKAEQRCFVRSTKSRYFHEVGG
jgi:hypothetical protein